LPGNSGSRIKTTPQYEAWVGYTNGKSDVGQDQAENRGVR